MQAPLQARNDSDAAQTDTARTVAQKRDIADNRPEAVAQGKLAEMMSNSPRVLQQRALSDAIHNSPRMVAQRHEMNALFGGAVKPQGGGAIPAEASPAPREEKTNNTGLPNQLKSGIESLSGMSMDHVKVHYNSEKPAQLQAHAYAQGNEIHLGAGQERHLPHEAWHVVQQAQGRVRPTLQMKARALNDDPSLESEADIMGEKAAQFEGDHVARNTVTEKRVAGAVTGRATGFLQPAPGNKGSPASGIAQLRLQAQPSSWNPSADPTPFFTHVQNTLNTLTNPGALNYQVDGRIYQTLQVNAAGLAPPGPRPRGTALVYRIIASPKIITIKDTVTNMNAAEPRAPGWFAKHFRSENSNRIAAHTAAATPGIGTDVDIDWNPTLAPELSQVPVHNAATNQFEMQQTPSTITLGHELGHADRFARGVGKVINPANGAFLRGGFHRALNQNRQVDKDVVTAEEVYNIGLQPANLPDIGINHMVANPDAANTITENDLRNEQVLARRVGYGPENTDL